MRRPSSSRAPRSPQGLGVRPFRRSTGGYSDAIGDTITGARALLAEQLSEMLYVEHKLADEVLPKMRGEVQEKHFREGIDKHLDETRRHVQNVLRVFEILAEAPRETESPGFDGLVRHHNDVAPKIDDPDVRDLFHASAAAHTEHFEISGYRSLLTLAATVGEPSAVRLLEENLHEEEEALEKMEKSVPERLNTRLLNRVTS